MHVACITKQLTHQPLGDLNEISEIFQTDFSDWSVMA